MTDAPPPPPAEPLKPIVLPPGSTAGPSGPSGPAAAPDAAPRVPYGAVPPGAATRSPGLLLAVAVTAFAGLVANSIGLVGFPSNAPVEQIYALGINLDLLAITLVCVVGAVLARRGYPLRSSTPVAFAAVAMAVVAVLAWIILGGIGSVVELVPPDRGRYMYASGGLFFAGAPWVLAAIFGAHAYRRGGTTRNNALALSALGTVGVLAVYAIVSSLLYGAGLTD